MPNKQRKVPMRMCVGCREMKPKRELVRVVRPKDSSCHLDFTGKAAGRGAYVCSNIECLRKARKSRALERALESKIDQEVYEALEQQLLQAPSSDIGPEEES